MKLDRIASLLRSRLDKIRHARDESGTRPRVTALRELRAGEVPSGRRDPRGWRVMDADGTRVGEVHDLIVDTATERTSYLDVKLDRDVVGLDSERDVLVPVGQTRLDDVNDHVVLGSLRGPQLGALPAYDHGAITPHYEATLLQHFDAGEADAADGV